MKTINVDHVLDAKGLACPMPIVKTKKAMAALDAGQVLQVEATDKGSKADMKAWAESSGHQYIGTKEEGEVLIHYLRKSSNDETLEKKHPNTITNDELQEKLIKKEDIVIVDVREEAEFAFGHIPNALNIPLGQLQDQVNQLESTKPMYVICRTGNRSDFACQTLTKLGFQNVFNVVPGMNEWKGESKSL